LVCNKCQTANEIRKGEVHKVRVTYAQSPSVYLADQVYLPFWVLTADITIRSIKIEGGKIRRFLKGEHSFEGIHRIWIFAGGKSDEKSEELGYRYSKTQPSYQAVQTPQFPITPVSVEHGEAMQIAEYLFLKNEVKKSGTLQSIDYILNFSDYELVYLPFEKNGGKIKPLI
jgi:hypothetical protein